MKTNGKIAQITSATNHLFLNPPPLFSSELEFGPFTTEPGNIICSTILASIFSLQANPSKTEEKYYNQ
jgi:hypothetical protein